MQNRQRLHTQQLPISSFHSQTIILLRPYSDMQSLWKSTLIKATHHPLFYHNAQIDARGMAGSWLFWSQPSDLPLADKTSDKFDTFAIIKNYYKWHTP